jgi:hypothetical protein
MLFFFLIKFYGFKKKVKKENDFKIHIVAGAKEESATL